MQVLIQRCKDGRFLKGENVWVNSKQEARGFSESTSAINYCVKRQFHDVRILLSFPNPEYDVALEVFRKEKQTLAPFGPELGRK
jgi:hypothetical protein